MCLHIWQSQQCVCRPPDVSLSAASQPKHVANSGSSESSFVHVPSCSRQTSLTTCLSVSNTHHLPSNACQDMHQQYVPVSMRVTLLSSFK